MHRINPMDCMVPFSPGTQIHPFEKTLVVPCQWTSPLSLKSDSDANIE
jgi:hypothetical protein